METTPNITDTRGIMVYAGLASPAARAFVAGTIAGIGCYALGMPRAAFDDEGRMRPLSLVSASPEATLQHFLVVPVATAAAVFLFT
tara:strand:- start:434 stop:691 length:258 start_codon:yes stop_codon:yes gene_type:complete